MPKSQQYTDVAHAAKQLGVSHRRVQQLIQKGRLPAQILAGSYIVKVADLEKVKVRKPGRPSKK